MAEAKLMLEWREIVAGLWTASTALLELQVFDRGEDGFGWRVAHDPPNGSQTGEVPALLDAQLAAEAAALSWYEQGVKQLGRCVRRLSAATFRVEALERELASACERVGQQDLALRKINAIRDSIVGYQGFNFSEHAYPLIAALDEAGYKGMGYEIARENLGTLIEQATAAEARCAAALPLLRSALEHLHEGDAKELARRALRQLLAEEPSHG